MYNYLKTIPILKLLYSTLKLFKVKGYLYNNGWVKSLIKGFPVTKKGEIIPWFTYPAISFLQEKLPLIKKSYKVFEYGSGNSSFYFAKWAQNVVSVEHNKKFYQRITNSPLPKNLTILLHENMDEYINCIAKQGCLFDIIIIDGKERVRCTEVSLKYLTDDGIIIFDNSDRDSYNNAYEILNSSGFKKIDFVGLGALSFEGWKTTIYYRDINILGI